ncbi:Uncharacterized protein TCM_020341 [Theobroma cacao]|uniref:Uncharacterized protein n=1 Tax=Theobroma cacao TaxID=3641 RepID=A0A061ESP0_THECC|nr:Uncharacterized protein TCM_020341 [Theobroma cacao]
MQVSRNNMSHPQASPKNSKDPKSFTKLVNLSLPVQPEASPPQLLLASRGGGHCEGYGSTISTLVCRNFGGALFLIFPRCDLIEFGYSQRHINMREAVPL